MTAPPRLAGTRASVVLARIVRPPWLNREIDVAKARWASATVAFAVTCSRLGATVTPVMPCDAR